MDAVMAAVIVAVVLLVVLAALSLRMVQQYQRTAITDAPIDETARRTLAELAVAIALPGMTPTVPLGEPHAVDQAGWLA